LSKLLPGVWRQGEEREDFDACDTNHDGKISLNGLF